MACVGLMGFASLYPSYYHYAPFEELLAVLSKPFEDQPQYATYAEPPLPKQRVLQTFCGT